MLYENVELHNVDEVVKIAGRKGVLLQRIPERVRARLRSGTQPTYRDSSGAEIRFVSDWHPARVTLCAYGENCKALLYFGDFQAGEYAVGESETVIEIPQPRFFSCWDFDSTKYPFSHKVVRIILGRGEFHLIHIEGADIRPPERDEIPRMRFLSYGSSITQGHHALSPMLTFTKQLAWRLEADAINLGAAGNAFCEGALADYIAARRDWDFATLEISVNMLNQGVPADEFKERAGYFVNTVAGADPGKPIFCISILPCFLDSGYGASHVKLMSTPEDFRRILKEITEESPYEKVYFIDGCRLIPGYYGLSQDIIHPGDIGMVEIAEKLAAFIRPRLDFGQEPGRIGGSHDISGFSDLLNQVDRK